jgi:hypothetical protein
MTNSQKMKNANIDKIEMKKKMKKKYIKIRRKLEIFLEWNLQRNCESISLK